MLHRFIFVNLWRSTYQGAQVSDTFGTRNAGQVPLEELVENQAISVDLREAVMACLSGGESRRWTIAELVERFKNLGVCASRASVTAALAELGLELELSGWAPWRLLERGTEWILEPKSELVALLSGVRRLPLKEAKILSEEHKAVLLVIIGYRQTIVLFCRNGSCRSRPIHIFKAAPSTNGRLGWVFSTFTGSWAARPTSGRPTFIAIRPRCFHGSASPVT